MIEDVSPMPSRCESRHAFSLLPDAFRLVPFPQLEYIPPITLFLPYFLPESVRKIARSVCMVRRLTLFVLMGTPRIFAVLRTNFGDFSAPAFDDWGRGNGLGLQHAC